MGRLASGIDGGAAQGYTGWCKYLLRRKECDAIASANWCARLGSLIVLGLVGGVLAGCVSAPAGQPAAPTAVSTFEVATDRPDNLVTAASDQGRLVIDITSKSGIGSAGVSVASGAMPSVVVMRLHLRGLEQMTFSYADTIVKLSAPSSGDGPVLQSVLDGGQERAIGPDSPYWMELARPASADDSPDGYFEVLSPKAFADSPPANFTLGWIDFFR